MKRPNVFIYLILGFLVKIYAALKGQRIIKKTTIKGPAIVLSNHTSFFDFIYTTAAAYPHRISYLVADKMAKDPRISFFLKLARAIPKCLFQPDPIATLNIFRILKKKGIVSIFPEGQISDIGKFKTPEFSIAKLLHKAKVDVYIIKHCNAYFVNPPWSKETFTGRIESIMEKIISKETIKSMSEQEIYDTILDKLDYNASTYNMKKQYKYKIKDISNFENVIYQCNSCAEEGLFSIGNRLVCPTCHKEMVFDVYGAVGNQRIDELYDFQIKHIKKEITDNPQFEIQSPVKLQSYRKKRLMDVGEGVLSLTRKTYRFEGIIDEKPATLHFDPKNVPYFPSDIGINIQIYEGYQIYQFVFEDKKMPTKFVIAGEIIHQLVKNEVSH
ncbi:MAG: 1-acyl-sn-glycerol-3-phosphate acyltransferase [Acholeplasmataceae bacterium]|nr:1-acyl-sn-glycerol-3-phosphate acyltransferase [Acholeplasmataceae bacterium]